MAEYALLDDNNYVLNVVFVEENEDVLGEQYICLKLHEMHGGRWIKTSGIETPSVAKNPAGIGYYYDSQRHAFIEPKPFESWILNETTCMWDPPIPTPNDDKMYIWDEETISWQEIVE